MVPTKMLIVKVHKGIAIRNAPRPEGQGGALMRNVPVGTVLYAFSIHNIDGVQYARLVPQNPVRPEWVRVAEADHSVEYVDVIDLVNEDSDAEKIAAAINLLADAVGKLESK